MLATIPRDFGPVLLLNSGGHVSFDAQYNRWISASPLGSTTMLQATQLASGIHSGLMACSRANQDEVA